MAGVSKQKQKLLIMEQLFRQRTDEAHAITGNQLIDILGSMGIKAERKTIYDDIATLCDAGLNIETTKIGHSNAYYMGERLFDDEELKIIVDIVASSKYLTIKKSNEIIKKLQTLTSDYKSPSLRRSIHIENRSKSFNDAVYRAVDTVQEAIFTDRMVEFTYADSSSADRKKQNKRDGRITASPYQIVWEGEQYYVICRIDDDYSDSNDTDSDDKIFRYRAEKMSDVAITAEKRRSLTDEEERRLRQLKSGGSASEGTAEELRIKFDNSLLEAVYERFGDKIAVHNNPDGTFTVDVTVQLSPAFWGWIFGFGDKVQILLPEYAAEIAGEKLKKIAELYN